MHYRNNSELPRDIQKALPTDAQTTYREVFNNAFPDSREKIRRNSEEMAHEAAWKAVEKEYEKRNGKWVKRSES